jgi:predicted Zn-dependent protease
MQKIYYLFLMFSFSIYSQVYTPIDTLCLDQTTKFIDDYTNRHKADIDRIKDENSGDVKRSIVATYNDQFDDLVKDFKKGELYFEKENQAYLQKIFDNIIASNPELKKDEMNIHFSRATSPNAYSVGDGTLIVQMGLFECLNNEAELVSVICHEISHYKLDHRNTSIKRHFENLHSRETRKEERQINRMKYNKQKLAENFMKDIVYSRKSKTRIHETEADSLGYIYFKRTKYNASHFRDVLKNLETADDEKDSLVDADYKKFFVTKNQKFIDEWLVMEDFSSYHYSKENIFKWNVDSLKTHPDCKKRVADIEKSLPKDNAKDFEINNSYFMKMKKAAPYEQVANYFHGKEYGFSLYEALKILNRTPNDVYLMKMVSENLKLLAKAKKEMKLNSYIPSIKPFDQTKSQQRFYNFMSNLSTNEIQRLSTDYIELTGNLK